MATFRVGIGSFIITEDKGVGFGTSPTDGLGNLQVKGVTKTTGSIVSGASTLTRYSGFAADNNKIFVNILLRILLASLIMGVFLRFLISNFENYLMYEYYLKSFYLILSVIICLIFYLLVSFFIKAFNYQDLKLKY